MVVCFDHLCLWSSLNRFYGFSNFSISVDISTHIISTLKSPGKKNKLAVGVPLSADRSTQPGTCVPMAGSNFAMAAQASKSLCWEFRHVTKSETPVKAPRLQNRHGFTFF